MKKILQYAILVTLSAITGCIRDPLVVEEEHVLPQKAVTIHVDNFDQYLSASKIALVEYFSEKCAVCASLSWVIDSMSTVFGDSILIGANNTDTDTLYKKCSVFSVPTYVIYKNGTETLRRSFITNAPDVFDTLTELLKQTVKGISDTGDTSVPNDTTILSDYLTLTQTTFDSVVMRKGTVAMVFFWYPGGAPCIYMDSVIRQFAPKFQDKAIIAKVHAWNEMPLTERYNIDFVPQYLFFKDSVYIEDLRHYYTQPGDTLIAILNGLIDQKLVNSP